MNNNRLQKSTLFLVKDVKTGQALSQCKTLEFAKKIQNESFNKSWNMNEKDNIVIFEIVIQGRMTVTRKVS